MEIIAEEGAGVIVVINRSMQNHMSRAIEIRQRWRAGETVAVEELRDYGVGAQILVELGVHEMILLTNTHHSLVGLEGYDLSIVGERSLDAPEETK
jgi:3,4-dihydroxy 2-butanone 4-phosphate synthase/GTP cyclohydrolase II